MMKYSILPHILQLRLLIDSHFVKGVEYNIRGCFALGRRDKIVVVLLLMLMILDGVLLASREYLTHSYIRSYAIK
jgi:hypothetical protein